ncbi:hypothetical protein JB92DRAFT_3088036 [Gautieria morchelliformis]|nr:hypothetical protein JB92DRAFT_3088036 [Gautieria morchelliformis]
MSTKYTEVLCIGLGLSGVCLGVQLQRKYQFTDVHFYERDASHSGTWYVNRYPGCACDIPAIFYSYSFEPNASWSRLLPPRDEIWRYLDGVVEKYNLRPRMTFRTESAAKSGRFIFRDLESGRQYIHECRLLFSAVGVLATPKEPNIPGKETFKGPMFHTARWRDDVELRNKSVVVVGNGCSASQMIPQITPLTKTLTQFIRTPHWLLEGENPSYSALMQWAFRRIPFLARLVRLYMFIILEKDGWRLFPGNETGARLRRAAEKRSKEFIFRVAPMKYHNILVPDYEMACKRRVIDTDSAYLRSLHAPNLHLTKDSIIEILPTGIRTATAAYPADVIIMATGFQANNGLGPLQIRGRGGEWLSDRWNRRGGPGAYNNTAVHGYPNFMVILGPNSGTGHAPATMAIENTVKYALTIVAPILSGDANEVEVTAAAEDAYLDRLQAASVDKVWNGPCGNWYVTADGWNSTLYPWSQTYSGGGVHSQYDRIGHISITNLGLARRCSGQISY